MTVKSVPTAEEAVRLSGELQALLSKGGFPPIKGLIRIGYCSRRGAHFGCTVEHGDWRLQVQSFRRRKEPLPRRGILSVVSFMYDPLGFVVPIISPAKSLLQSLCKLNYRCDEEISEAELVPWIGWLRNLSDLRTIALARCFKPPGFFVVRRVQLHYFSDATEFGYGAVLYFRIVDDTGAVHCLFVLRKSHITP